MSEWTVAEVSVPGRWIVRQQGDRYVIILQLVDGGEIKYGSAANMETAMEGAEILSLDMRSRIGSTKKKQTKRGKKKDVIGTIPCPGPGQMCLFPRSSRSS